ncbi:hypothetical protein ACFVFS_29815 [Kitasatospora sp. NPDC057692]|uniref:hypothetical protein n=1 Tax=Kitasatospora sp. NPDC057692 TaxID=3346215 RepID=UPI00369B8671
MNEVLEFRMLDAKGQEVRLESLLSLVPENDWVWSILEFDGILLEGTELGYAEIQEKVNSSPHGYAMPWTQIGEFAAGIRQCFELLLVASKSGLAINPEQLTKMDFSAFPLVLTASDSTWWTVQLATDVQEASDLANQLRAIYEIEGERKDSTRR